MTVVALSYLSCISIFLFLLSSAFSSLARTAATEQWIRKPLKRKRIGDLLSSSLAFLFATWFARETRPKRMILLLPLSPPFVNLLLCVSPLDARIDPRGVDGDHVLLQQLERINLDDCKTFRPEFNEARSTSPLASPCTCIRPVRTPRASPRGRRGTSQSRTLRRRDRSRTCDARPRWPTAEATWTPEKG